MVNLPGGERVYDMNEKKCPDHNEVQRL
eukprot:SAG22_NODE_6885_length_799_cov_1.121429_1_plen_27_part_10